MTRNTRRSFESVRYCQSAIWLIDYPDEAELVRRGRKAAMFRFLSEPITETLDVVRGYSSSYIVRNLKPVDGMV